MLLIQVCVKDNDGLVGCVTRTIVISKEVRETHPTILQNGLRGLWGVVLLLLLMPLAANAAADAGPEIGQPAPNLIGRTLDDESYRLKSDRGSPKVINFFWVGCKPCRQEMPELAKLEQQFAGVKFISVHTLAEKTENIAKFVQSLSGAPSNIVQTSGGVQEVFQYRGLPHTILLDSNNVVLMNLSGYTPGNMKRLIKALQQLPKK